MGQPPLRRTELKRKTPLRAKQWGITKSTKSTNRKRAGAKELSETRHLVFERDKGHCAVCHERINAEPASYDWEDHHVFYRSHVARRVRHELWNRVPLHRGCHRRAHDHLAVRERLERLAINRLYVHLGPDVVEQITKRLPDGATTPAAFVRAYEAYARSPIVLHS